MNWDAMEFWAKMIVLPIAFLAATGGVVYGAIFLSLGTPGQRLTGLAVLAGSMLVWMVGMWLAFGRPTHWFPPGENTEFDPRR